MVFFKSYWGQRTLKQGSIQSGCLSVSFAAGWIIGRILRRFTYGPEWSLISNTFLLFGAIFAVITAILLFIGVTKEYKSLLLPWMVGGAPLILSSLGALAIDAREPKSAWDYFFLYVWLPFFIFYFSYHVLITISYYCELKAKQNEQTNDLESPPPEKEKEVKVQVTTSSLKQIDAVD